MEKVRAFLARKNITFSAKRYFIDAMSAMAQGLFCTLLVGTILDTIGKQFGIGFLTDTFLTIKQGDVTFYYTIGGFCSLMVGPAMAVAIGKALEAPPLVLFSLITVGFATNVLGGTGGPLAVFFVAILAAEVGKAISKETKIDILVTPIVTILAGIGFAALVARPIGTAATSVGDAIKWATELQPFFMGILVSVIVGQGIGTSMLQMGNIVRNVRIWIPPTLASAVTGPIATCLFKLQMNGSPVSSGMGTCGFVGQIGVYTGWLNDIASGTKAAITGFDWMGLILISFVLPAVLTWLFAIPLRNWGWIKDGDLKLDL